MDMPDGHNREFLNVLDFAKAPFAPGESAVVDFTASLFRVLRYNNGHRAIRTRKDIPFLICGEWKHSTTDVCLLERLQNNIMLLVQERRRVKEN